MMDDLNRGNFHKVFGAFIANNHLRVRETANPIGCSEPTLKRLLEKASLPSDEMLRQAALVLTLGFGRYSKLSAAERAKLSESLGAVSGGVIGLGSVTAIVGATGTIAGLSAAGISSGLAAMGTLVGGGMAAGIAVAAVIPAVAAGAGFGIIRTVKHLKNEARLNSAAFDPKWELTTESN
jgi:hypothetical protein